MRVPRSLEPAVEATAYFIIAAVTRATTAPVTASVEQRDGRLLVDIGTGDAPHLAELEDRVGAIDGRLRVTPGRGGERRVHAELPCA